MYGCTGYVVVLPLSLLDVGATHGALPGEEGAADVQDSTRFGAFI